ncbi:MAG: hypothetical protein Q7R31_01405, partial [Candidatus Levybacteria bacterium]|nr:hypothetical protein [Candidatus Levybacteria bacterium]
VLPIANGGTNKNLTLSNGGIVWSDADSLEVLTASGSTGLCLLSGGAGTPSWGTCDTSLGSNLWNSQLGALYPNNTTMDLLIGGTSTSSAKFGFINVNSGTPTATVSGTTGATYLTSAGLLQTTNNQQLILGGATTGDITLSPLNGAGTTLSTGNLNLSTGKVYQIAGTEVLSGTTLGTGVLTSSLTTVGTIGTGTWQGTSVKADYGGTGLTTYAQGDILYAGSLNPTALSKLVAGTAGYVLTTGGAGANPSWTDMTVASGNFWRQNNGTLYPANSTVDLLVGGTSSVSAKFSVLNINSGTPTATLSAGTAGGALLTATGNLQTTAKQSLTLGGGDTGNIVLSGFGTGIVHSNASGVLSSSAVNLASADVTGVLPIANGGTNKNLTLSNGGIVWSDADSLEVLTASGSTGLCLLSGGAG